MRPNVEVGADQPRRPGVAHQQRPVLPGQRAQLRPPVLTGVRVGVAQLAEDGVQGEFQQLVLGVDVPVDGHRGDVQLGGQAAHGEPGQALGVQQPHGDPGDPVPVEPGRLPPAPPAAAPLPVQPHTGPGPLPPCLRHGHLSSIRRTPPGAAPRRDAGPHHCAAPPGDPSAQALTISESARSARRNNTAATTPPSSTAPAPTS